DIATPHEGTTGAAAGYGAEYRFFSTDLSLAIVQQFGSIDAQMSLEMSEKTPFLRTDYPSGEVDSPCLSSCYRPLVTGAPGYENVPAGTVFAPQPCEGPPFCDPDFVGASPDLGHVVLSSVVGLTEGAPANGLYEWSGGKLALVSVLPNGNAVPASSLPGLGIQNQIVRNAVSADGSRIVWSANGDLYVRDTVSESEATLQVGSGAAQFQTASADDSKIVFSEKGDLRECVIVESEGEPHCALSDLSPAAPGESPSVLGTIPGASEDASYVYFVAGGVLQNGGVPVAGAQPGANLYVSHDGTIKLVAELSSDDSHDWNERLRELTARVSPDGRWFAFMSDRSLTGYDNRDSVSGTPDEEVYLYDATAKNGEGTLVCASCDSTGARPHGIELKSFNNRLVAASVPGWTAFSVAALHQSRYLSDSGRLFFDSSDPLVPQDSNGTVDVYEYESPSVGDCTASSSTFAGSSGGCVNLISSGTSKEESKFVDASEDGNSVFFDTTSQLARADTDSLMDVYDARVDGGFAEPPSPPACEGDACQNPISAPEDQTPGSLTYSGPGNQIPLATVTVKHKSRPLTRAQKLTKALSACKRYRAKRKREECVRTARKQYAQARSGKANTKKGKG
ncbi:MAG: hypothetical protein WAN93_02685, partial [Solirubrobacteraceae bacterium]